MWPKLESKNDEVSLNNIEHKKRFAVPFEPWNAEKNDQQNCANNYTFVKEPSFWIGLELFEVFTVNLRKIMVANITNDTNKSYK